MTRKSRTSFPEDWVITWTAMWGLEYVPPVPCPRRPGESESVYLKRYRATAGHTSRYMFGRAYQLLKARTKRAAAAAKLIGRPKSLKCEICHSTRKIVADHDHRTGKGRGWLCDRCNRVLGQINDDPRIAMLMYWYLREHAEAQTEAT